MVRDTFQRVVGSKATIFDMIRKLNHREPQQTYNLWQKPWNTLENFPLSLLSPPPPPFCNVVVDSAITSTLLRELKVCGCFKDHCFCEDCRFDYQWALGTSHCLSPGWWRGGGGLVGITWFLGEQEKGSVVTENPKGGGSVKTLEGFRGGEIKFAWKMETWGGGDRESHQMLLGGITSVN